MILFPTVLTEHCKNSLILFRWLDELPAFDS